MDVVERAEELVAASVDEEELAVVAGEDLERREADPAFAGRHEEGEPLADEADSKPFIVAALAGVNIRQKSLCVASSSSIASAFCNVRMFIHNSAVFNLKTVQAASRERALERQRSCSESDHT